MAMVQTYTRVPEMAAYRVRIPTLLGAGHRHGQPTLELQRELEREEGIGLLASRFANCHSARNTRSLSNA